MPGEAAKAEGAAVQKDPGVLQAADAGEASGSPLELAKLAGARLCRGLAAGWRQRSWRGEMGAKEGGGMETRGGRRAVARVGKKETSGGA